MGSRLLSPPVFGFIVGTRAALAFGMGLLVAGKIPEARRRSLALTFIIIGAATTIPALKALLDSRTDERSLDRRQLDGTSEA